MNGPPAKPDSAFCTTFLRLIVLFVLTTLPAFPADAPMPSAKRVLLISDFSVVASQAIGTMEDAMFSELMHTPYRIELYTESLETALFPDVQSQQQIQRQLLDLYEQRRPDLIIAVGPASLQFVIGNHERSFTDVPVVFCGSTPEMLLPWTPTQNFTGVWGVPQPEETLKLALLLQPSAKHVFVVGGQGSFDRAVEALTKKAFYGWESRLDFTYLTELDMPTLLERLRHLPNDSVVYHTSLMVDAAGSRFVNSTQSVPMIASAANAPVFVTNDANVEDGTVGGDVVSLVPQGRIAGDMAVRILRGGKPSDIPVEHSASIYLFDWNALHRWKLKPNLLPPNTQFLNRPESVWDSYRWFILGGLAVMLTELGLIIGLLWHRRLRRKAEAQFAVMNERLRLAVEAGKAVGWDVDYRNGRNEWFGDLESMFGIPSDTFTAAMGDFRNQIYPDDRESVVLAIERAQQNHTTYSEDFRIVRRDGTVRWITATGRFFHSAGGTAGRMLGMAVDITDRKLAAEALSRLSGQLIAVQEEERKRIAREIHDDFQQRLAILTFDLSNLAATLEDTGREPDLAIQLCDLAASVQALGTDLHSLSHRLHPSILENLGLVAAVESFCEEFSSQHKIDVNFTNENASNQTTAGISLCLFRIVQEALRNVKKHSGSKSAEVRLEGLDNSIHLVVSDQGIGFDTSSISPQAGIGIKSMEERLRLVGGNLRVTSRPGAGTRIDAYVPIPRQS